MFLGESWTTYHRHIRKLDRFHMKCLRRLARIKWQDKVTNTEVLRLYNISGIEAMISRSQLRWSGHVVRMPDYRIPNRIFYVELESGQRSRGGQMEQFKDSLKATQKSSGINLETWEADAQIQTRWREICHSGVTTFEAERLTKQELKLN